MTDTPDNVRHLYKFRSEEKLAPHFKWHYKEFGAENKRDYLRIANVFLNKPVDGEQIMTCIRPNGQIQRYDKQTNEYALIERDATTGIVYIITYFRPAPIDVFRSGGPFNTRRVRDYGLDYFHRGCNE